MTKRDDLNELILGSLVQDGCHAPLGIDWHPNYIVSDIPELRGMDFLPEAGGEAWRNYWPDPKAGRDPNRRGIHNWDGVGRVNFAGHSDWLLVEAKAHVQEFVDSPTCGAGSVSREKIMRALQKTRMRMGLADSLDARVPASWLKNGGYQIINRFTSLGFLLNEAQPRTSGRVLFIYYLNDRFSGRECPKSVDEWRYATGRKFEELKSPHNHSFKARTHHLFIDVKKT